MNILILTLILWVRLAVSGNFDDCSIGNDPWVKFFKTNREKVLLDPGIWYKMYEYNGLNIEMQTSEWIDRYHLDGRDRGVGIARITIEEESAPILQCDCNKIPSINKCTCEYNSAYVEENEEYRSRGWYLGYHVTDERYMLNGDAISLLMRWNTRPLAWVTIKVPQNIPTKKLYEAPEYVLAEPGQMKCPEHYVPITDFELNRIKAAFTIAEQFGDHLAGINDKCEDHSFSNGCVVYDFTPEKVDNCPEEEKKCLEMEVIDQCKDAFTYFEDIQSGWREAAMRGLFTYEKHIHHISYPKGCFIKLYGDFPMSRKTIYFNHKEDDGSAHGLKVRRICKKNYNQHEVKYEASGLCTERSLLFQKGVACKDKRSCYHSTDANLNGHLRVLHSDLLAKYATAICGTYDKQNLKHCCNKYYKEAPADAILDVDTCMVEAEHLCCGERQACNTDQDCLGVQKCKNRHCEFADPVEKKENCCLFNTPCNQNEDCMMGSETCVKEGYKIGSTSNGYSGYCMPAAGEEFQHKQLCERVYNDPECTFGRNPAKCKTLKSTEQQKKCEQCTKCTSFDKGLSKFRCEMLEEDDFFYFEGAKNLMCANVGCFENDANCAHLGDDYYCSSKGICEKFSISKECKVCTLQDDEFGLCCGKHDGPCNHDEHCGAGLVCGSDNFRKHHPNVTGVAAFHDVCVEPDECLPHHTYELLKNETKDGAKIAVDKINFDDYPGVEVQKKDLKTFLKNRQWTKVAQLEDGDIECNQQSPNHYCSAKMHCKTLLGGVCKPKETGDSLDRRCGFGEGDCDNDNECGENLKCRRDNFFVEHPALAHRTHLSEVDVCVPIRECTPDCDPEEDGCKVDHKCDGIGKEKEEFYCQKIGDTCVHFKWHECDLGGCSEGDGNCDDDRQCSGGLMCKDDGFLRQHPEKLDSSFEHIMLEHSNVCMESPQCRIKHVVKKEFQELCDIVYGDSDASILPKWLMERKFTVVDQTKPDHEDYTFSGSYGTPKGSFFQFSENKILRMWQTEALGLVKKNGNPWEPPSWTECHKELIINNTYNKHGVLVKFPVKVVMDELRNAIKDKECPVHFVTDETLIKFEKWFIGALDNIFENERTATDLRDMIQGAGFPKIAGYLYQDKVRKYPQCSGRNQAAHRRRRRVCGSRRRRRVRRSQRSRRQCRPSIPTREKARLSYKALLSKIKETFASKIKETFASKSKCVEEYWTSYQLNGQSVKVDVKLANYYVDNILKKFSKIDTVKLDDNSESGQWKEEGWIKPRWEYDNGKITTYVEAGNTVSMTTNVEVNVEWLKKAIPALASFAVLDTHKNEQFYAKNNNVGNAEKKYILGCIRRHKALDDRCTIYESRDSDLAIELRHIIQHRIGDLGWLSRTDLIYALGALSVDCLSNRKNYKSGYSASLFDKLKWGRWDSDVTNSKMPIANHCESQDYCNSMPNPFPVQKREDEDRLEKHLLDQVNEVTGKFDYLKNGEVIALLGLHGLGCVEIDGERLCWTENEYELDTQSFANIKKIFRHGGIEDEEDLHASKRCNDAATDSDCGVYYTTVGAQAVTSFSASKEGNNVKISELSVSNMARKRKSIVYFYKVEITNGNDQICDGSVGHASDEKEVKFEDKKCEIGCTTPAFGDCAGHCTLNGSEECVPKPMLVTVSESSNYSDEKKTVFHGPLSGSKVKGSATDVTWGSNRVLEFTLEVPTEQQKRSTRVFYEISDCKGSFIHEEKKVPTVLDCDAAGMMSASLSTSSDPYDEKSATTNVVNFDATGDDASREYSVSVEANEEELHIKYNAAGWTKVYFKAVGFEGETICPNTEEIQCDHDWIKDCKGNENCVWIEDDHEAFCEVKDYYELDNTATEMSFHNCPTNSISFVEMRSLDDEVVKAPVSTSCKNLASLEDCADQEHCMLNESNKCVPKESLVLAMDLAFFVDSNWRRRNLANIPESLRRLLIGQNENDTPVGKKILDRYTSDMELPKFMQEGEVCQMVDDGNHKWACNRKTNEDGVPLFDEEVAKLYDKRYNDNPRLLLQEKVFNFAKRVCDKMTCTQKEKECIASYPPGQTRKQFCEKSSKDFKRGKDYDCWNQLCGKNKKQTCSTDIKYESCDLHACTVDQICEGENECKYCDEDKQANANDFCTPKYYNHDCYLRTCCQERLEIEDFCLVDGDYIDDPCFAPNCCLDELAPDTELPFEERVDLICQEENDGDLQNICYARLDCENREESDDRRRLSSSDCDLNMGELKVEILNHADEASSLSMINLHSKYLVQLHEYLHSGIQAWRSNFDDVFIKLSELGCEDYQGTAFSHCASLADPCKDFIYTFAGTKTLDPRVIDQQCNAGLPDFWKVTQQLDDKDWEDWLGKHDETKPIPGINKSEGLLKCDHQADIHTGYEKRENEKVFVGTSHAEHLIIDGEVYQTRASSARYDLGMDAINCAQHHSSSCTFCKKQAAKQCNANKDCEGFNVAGEMKDQGNWKCEEITFFGSCFKGCIGMNRSECQEYCHEMDYCTGWENADASMKCHQSQEFTTIPVEDEIGNKFSRRAQANVYLKHDWDKLTYEELRKMIPAKRIQYP